MHNIFSLHKRHEMKGTKTLKAWSFDIHMNLNIMDSIRQLAYVNPNLNFVKLRNSVEKSWEK